MAAAAISKCDKFWMAALMALLTAGLEAVWSPPALAAVPATINYQGFLTDAVSGQPLALPVTMGFALYDSGGRPIYSETQSVTPTGGVFNVLIGSGTSLTPFSGVPFDQPYWLEITVGGQVLAPRQPLASAATALRARVAESLAPVPGLGTENTAIGVGALGVNTQGFLNTADGAYALSKNTTGFINTGTGAFALSANTYGYGNTANGNDALRNNTGGSSNVASGSYALTSNTQGYSNTATGESALKLNILGAGNSANGQNSLSSNTTGDFNIGIGINAGSALTTGDYNIAIGNVGVAGESATIRIGDSHQTRSFMAGVKGVPIGGANALTVVIDSSTGQLGVAAVNGTGSGNVAYGPSTLPTNSTGAYNTALGQVVLQSNSTGAFNTAAGFAALNANSTGVANVAVGSNALVRNTSGNGNVAVGDASQANTTTGNANTSLGQGALVQNISGSNNLALGANAGSALTTGSSNIAIGNPGTAAESGTIRIGDGNQTRAFLAGINGVALPGAQTVVINTSGQLGVAAASGTGTGNVSYGSSALASNTTGAFNTAAGVGALNANSTGTANVALGSNALVRNTTGSGNVSVGDANSANNTTGSTNTAMGQLALVENIHGSNNIAIGYQAGSNLSDLITGTWCPTCAAVYNDNNIEIGNAGLYTDRNLIRIGNTSHTATYIAGALYSPSDRNLKQNFAEVDALDVLSKLVALPVTRWTYKNDDQHTSHLGPVAQDFHAAFGLGADDKHIATIDEGGVALAAIKGLFLKLQARDEELAVLKRELQHIKSQLGLK
jgi:hypothetical protein